MAFSFSLLLSFQYMERNTVGHTIGARIAYRPMLVRIEIKEKKKKLVQVGPPLYSNKVLFTISLKSQILHHHSVYTPKPSCFFFFNQRMSLRQTIPLSLFYFLFSMYSDLIKTKQKCILCFHQDQHKSLNIIFQKKQCSKGCLEHQ